MSKPFFKRTARVALTLIAWGSLAAAVAVFFLLSAPPIQARLSPLVCDEGQHLVQRDLAFSEGPDFAEFNLYCTDDQDEINSAWRVIPLMVGPVVLSMLIFAVVGVLQRRLR